MSDSSTLTMEGLVEAIDLAAQPPTPPLSAEQMEKALVAEQIEKDTTQYDPMEAAAKIFSTFLPQYQHLVRRLSNRQARRLLNALIEVPLQKKDYKHPTKEERAAFMLGDRLLQAKWTMMLVTLEQHARQQAEARANEAPPGAVPIEDLNIPTGSGSMEGTGEQS